jgi:hypothetical protein
MYLFRLPGTYITSSSHHIVSHDLWHVWLCHIFQNCFLNSALSEKRIWHEVWTYIYYTLPETLFLEDFSETLSQTHPGLSTAPHVLSDLKWTWILFIKFSKSHNIRFHANPSSSSQVVLCGQTDRHDEAVTFHNFANTPKNPKFCKITTQSEQVVHVENVHVWQRYCSCWFHTV